MKDKKAIILPRANYTYKYNVNNTTPKINIKKNDYDSIRDIVEGKDENTTLIKPTEHKVNNIINKFQMVLF